MRQVILDTETTGIDPSQGHRVIEIGCLELDNRRLTGRSFHYYLQPDREIEEEAIAVHGITNEFLKDKPRFSDVVDEFLAFVKGAELVIHNAPFDIGFLDHELKRLDRGFGCMTDYCGVLDTLLLARARHPGQRNSLDALAKRYGADQRDRTYHGALLDSEILADIYLAMTGGQVGLALGGDDSGEQADSGGEVIRRVAAGQYALRVVTADPVAEDSHRSRLAAIDKSSGGKCLWIQLEQGNSVS